MIMKTFLLGLLAYLLCGSATLSSGGATMRKEKDPDALFDVSQMLVPFWEGDTVYNESIMPTREKSGNIPAIDLLYPIDEILEVKSANLKTTYQEGVDYSLENGQFIVNPSGQIKSLSYLEFHPADGQAGFESRNGGYVLWKEGSWFHERQTVITYKHQAGYQGYIPEGKGRLLPNILAKLEAKQDINLLVYGDSISTGGNSSGHPDINVSPWMPIYPKLFQIGLEERFGAKVNLINASVGGTDSAWGVSKLRSEILNKYDDLDLAIVAFGMNDTTRDPDGFAANIKNIVRGLKSKYKDIDILMIATMLPNEEAVTFWGHQSEFYEPLKEMEAEGLVAVNMGGVHAGLLQRKKYVDMTGNNINHANDFLARAYAQTLLRTMEVTDYGLPEEEPSGSSSETSSEIPSEVPSETPSEVPSETPSAPASSTASVPSDTAVSSSQPSEEKPSTKGCGGSIPFVGVSAAIALAGGATIAYRKKKKND